MKLTIGKPDYLYHIERWLCSIEDAEQAGRAIAFGVGFGRGEDGRLKAITNAESIVKAFEAEAQLHQSAERERVLREALDHMRYGLEAICESPPCTPKVCSTRKDTGICACSEDVAKEALDKAKAVLAQSASKETDNV